MSPRAGASGDVGRSWLAPGAALVYAVMARAWQALAGLITVLVIGHFFSPVTQGFYYTFSSLLALQVFVELGLGVVIINTASHEWARLHLDASGSIAGDDRAKSRLVSLGHFILRWYSVAAVVFVLVGGASGYWFLSTSAPEDAAWRLPWFTAVLVVGGTLCVMPFVSLLEGCNQVKAVHRFRLCQAVAANLVLWMVIAAGGNLWAIAAMLSVNFASTVFFLLVRYRSFFGAFWSRVLAERMHWRSEIWPMQWRMGIQGLVNYFMYSLFTPVIFYYSGAEAAGRMGMTWQAVGALQMMALAWIQVRVPRFGALIVHRQYGDLDREWWHAAIVSTTFVTIAAALFLGGVYALGYFGYALAARLLDVPATALFSAGLVFAHIGQCQAAYLRAHKREVLTAVVTLSALTMGASVWWLGRRFGIIGVAWAYFGVMVFVAFPSISLVWKRAYKQWRAETANP